MNKEVLDRLRTAGLLSNEVKDLGNVPTGNYALNKVISGDFNKGIPIGMITQFHGESSTAKTVFATHILKEAQVKGYYTMLIDSENAYNPEFAKHLGIDPEKLIYAAPQTLEDCFQTIQEAILEIRELDKDTPIVVAYDSIAVSPSKAEFEAEGFEGNNMQGAIRAKSTGACLRKINPILRDKKVALIVINQLRSKVGVMFGDPTTMAAGGKSLDYYLGVNLKCVSNRSKDFIKDERDNIVGIKGVVKNTKNKVSIPFRECEFELIYDKGLSSYSGVLELMLKEGLLEQNGAWYTIPEGESWGEEKFQKKTFTHNLKTSPKPAWVHLRNILGISVESLGEPSIIG